MSRAIIFRMLQRIARRMHKRGLSKWPIVKPIYRFLIRRTKPAQVVIHGNQMIVDPYDTMGLAVHENYEPDETMFVAKHIKPDAVVVDIGANIGYYTLLLAKLVGPRGKVFAFEPDAKNFSLLKKNVHLNKYKNIVLVNKAVGAKTGKTQLYISEDPGDHRTYPCGKKRKVRTVDMVALDDHFRNYLRAIDFIKMDVQGAEESVLRGMSRVVQKHPHLKILAEFWPPGLKTAGVDPQHFLHKLRQHGFQLHLITQKGRAVPVTVEGILRAATKTVPMIYCVRDKTISGA